MRTSTTLEKTVSTTKDPNRCKLCGKSVEIGDWPFCPHDPPAGRRDLKLQPTIVYRNATGKCWFPVGDQAKPPAGYERFELHTTRERDKFEKEINAQESAKLRQHIYEERQRWNETVGHHRLSLEQTQKELRQRGYEPKLIGHILEDLDRREHNYDRRLKEETGFHIEANHYYGTHHHDE